MLDGNAPAVLEINLDALAANYARVSAEAAPARVAAVLKANAYGLGVRTVALRLAAEGCAEFFVSSLAEGLELRKVLPKACVYVLEGGAGSAQDCRAAGLVPVLNTAAEVAEWMRAGSAAPAALQVDTGMTRAGLDPEEIEALQGHGDRSGFRPSLLITHLACADEPEHPLNRLQIERFAAVSARFPGVPTSIGNSSGIWLGPKFRGDVVRPGLALYGGNPQGRAANPMQSVVRLTARVLQLRVLRQPASIGYGATAARSAGSIIATVGAGYADGLPRALGNRGNAYLNGQRVPIVGRVSMDLMTLDVTALGLNGCAVGDAAELLGPDVPLETVADAAGTVVYEILTQLSERLARRYIGAP